MIQQDPNKLVSQATELRNNGRALEAVKTYKQAVKLLDELDLPVEAADCVHMIGVSYKIDNNMVKAMPYYEEAVQRFTKLGRPDKVGSVQRDIGIMLAYHKDYNSALEWLRKSEQALTKTDNLNELGITQSKIGLMYVYLKDYSRAENVLKKGLNTIQAAKHPHSFYIMTTLLHLAALEIVQNRYESTLLYVKQAYDLLPKVEKEEGSMNRRRSEILGIRAHAYFGLGKAQEASQDIIDALQLLEDISDEAAAVVYENIRAAKLLELLKENNPDLYDKASKSLNFARIERLKSNNISQDTIQK